MVRNFIFSLLLFLVEANVGSASSNQTLINGYANVQAALTKDAYTFSLGQFSPIFQFKYSNAVLFQSNVLFNIASDQSTRTNLNYVTFNFILNDYLTLVVGKFLSPLSQYRESLSPAWINKLSKDPVGFSEELSVAPLRHLGVQLRGGEYIGPVKTHFALFVSNGPQLINEVGQIVVTNEDRNSESRSKLIGGRIGADLFPEFQLNVSGAVAKVGLGQYANRPYHLWGTDFVYRAVLSLLSGTEIRGEYLSAFVELTDDSRRRESAWYLQTSYVSRFFKLQPVIQYGEFVSKIYKDGSQISGSQVVLRRNGKKRRQSVGLNYLLYPSTILKLSFNRDYDDIALKTSTILELAVGF